MLLMVAVTYLFRRRAWASGAFNIPIGWGFAIINFVWWIGIGHAGTLISAILLLLRQQWRTSINRFAEAMTLFAVACAGLFPLLHLGRPWLAYWLFPYPDTMKMWPQFPQPAGVGCFRGFDLRDRVAAVLVHRPDSGPGDAARPRAEIAPRKLFTAFWPWAGAARRCIGTGTKRRPCCWPAWPRRWSFPCTRSSVSTLPSASFPDGTRRFFRPTSSPERFTRDSPWC